MIMTGWKEIASRLNCAVRTAQRWEASGLPISRPFPGRRSFVVADSERLDSWLRDGVFWQRQDFARLSEIQRSRELRIEVTLSRRTLRENLSVLRSKFASLQHTAELQKQFRAKAVKHIQKGDPSLISRTTLTHV